MAKPTHMYLEVKDGALLAHYGKLKLVTEMYEDSYRIAFKHPKRGEVSSFLQIGEPVKYDLGNEKEVRDLKNGIKRDAVKKGIFVVRPDDIYCFHELEFYEVPMGQAKTTIPPGGLYTKSIGTCLGISIYNENTRYTHLFHTPGCEPETMPKIIGHLEHILSEQGTGMEHVKVNIASGLLAFFWGDEVEATIRSARENLLLFFFSKDIEPVIHFAETRGEAYMFMSIEPHQGLVEVIKKHVID